MTLALIPPELLCHVFEYLDEKVCSYQCEQWSRYFYSLMRNNLVMVMYKNQLLQLQLKRECKERQVTFNSFEYLKQISVSRTSIRIRILEFCANQFENDSEEDQLYQLRSRRQRMLLTINFTNLFTFTEYTSICRVLMQQYQEKLDKLIIEGNVTIQMLCERQKDINLCREKLSILRGTT